LRMVVVSMGLRSSVWGCAAMLGAAARKALAVG
jgi:hypothetical protein